MYVKAVNNPNINSIAMEEGSYGFTSFVSSSINIHYEGVKIK
jgi:hypothetical protein